MTVSYAQYQFTGALVPGYAQPPPVNLVVRKSLIELFPIYAKKDCCASLVDLVKNPGCLLRLGIFGKIYYGCFVVGDEMIRIAVT